MRAILAPGHRLVLPCVTNINLILISPLCHLCNLRLNDILWLVYGFHNLYTIDVKAIYIHGKYE
jgi:hypothetical protein